jgi:hypothetical protein
MTLELGKVTEQVGEIGRELAAGAARRQAALPDLRAQRKRFARDLERLRDLAESPPGREARCARPTDEAIDASFPAPAPPALATILAADGSQIPPDPHGLVQYYLINVGSLVYRHGSGQAPEAASEPRVAPAVDAEGYLVSADQLGARRDVAEIQKLAELAEAESGRGPLVALLDSTIGLRAWSAAIPQAEQDVLQKRYLAQLDRLWSAGAALAGFLSRSRQAGVGNLLDLAQVAEASDGRAGPSPYLGITDQALWGDLQPGERSALFCQDGTPAVYFFYLNTEPSGWSQAPGVEAEPARIEVPEWVAHSPEKLAWVHALVYDQCRINDGYPYALTRADELAIIFNEEREALEAMLLQAMSRQGLPLPRLSPKERQKRRARPRSRRRR